MARKQWHTKSSNEQKRRDTLFVRSVHALVRSIVVAVDQSLCASSSWTGNKRLHFATSRHHRSSVNCELGCRLQKHSCNARQNTPHVLTYTDGCVKIHLIVVIIIIDIHFYRAYYKKYARALQLSTVKITKIIKIKTAGNKNVLPGLRLPSQHYHPVASTKLYCLVTEAHIRKQH